MVQSKILTYSYCISCVGIIPSQFWRDQLFGSHYFTKLDAQNYTTQEIIFEQAHTHK